jgi:hypothetical protein
MGDGRRETGDGRRASRCRIGQMTANRLPPDPSASEAKGPDGAAVEGHEQGGS